jgi:hypothetical protein
MYRNGSLILTDSTAITSLKNVTTPLTIGADFDAGSSDSLTRPYDGVIPVVKLYNTALSSQQVLQNYNSYKTRFNLS